MRPYHLSALFILLYWQLGPLPQRTVDSAGQVRWSVSAMAGKGQWEDASFDCDGNLVSAVPAKYQDIGVRVDVESPGTSPVRLTLAAGSSRHTGDFGGTPVTGSATTYGAQLAWEPRPIGIGFGVVRDETGELLPSTYLRVGRRDRVHLRLESAPPSETRLMAGVFRAGIGFKNGTVGLGFGPYAEKTSQAVVFGDFNLPLSRSVDLRLGAQGGPGIEVGQWGFAAGLRIHN